MLEGDNLKSYEELEKENAELKRQLEERQNVKFNMRIIVRRDINHVT